MKRLFLVLILGLFLTGCVSSNAQRNAAVGGGAGALGSLIFGGDTQTTLLYGAGGAVLGYMLGNEQDKKVIQSQQAQRQQYRSTQHQPITECNKVIVRTMENGQWVETIEERCEGRRITNTY